MPERSGYHQDSACLGVFFLATVFSLITAINRFPEDGNSSKSVPESVLESPGHRLQVSHSPGPCSLSSLSLLAPFIRAQLGARVAALATGCTDDEYACFHGKQPLTFVLTVERPATASATDGVGLGVAFTGHVR